MIWITLLIVRFHKIFLDLLISLIPSMNWLKPVCILSILMGIQSELSFQLMFCLLWSHAFFKVSTLLKFGNPTVGKVQRVVKLFVDFHWLRAFFSEVSFLNLNHLQILQIDLFPSGAFTLLNVIIALVKVFVNILTDFWQIVL